MTESPRHLLLERMPLLLQGSEKLSDAFHQRLFATKADLAPRFAPTAEQRRTRFAGVLDLVAKHLEQGTQAWEREVPAQEDAFLQLCAMSRRDGDLHHIPDSAHLPVGEAFLGALAGLLKEDAEDELAENQEAKPAQSSNADELKAWAELYAEFSNAQRIIASSKIHRGFDLTSAPQQEAVLTSELDEDLQLPALLQSLSLCSQYLKLSFQDEVERPSGHMLLKSGQVLEASCRDEGGQPAFRILMMHPHQRVRVHWVAAPEPAVKPVGSMQELLEQCELDHEAQGLIDPAQLAANGAAPQMSSDDQDEDEETGIPTPVMVPIPLESLPPLGAPGPDDTQPMALAQEQEGGFVPAELALTRIVRRWVPKLQEIPHLRALLMLEQPKASEGKFWSRDGAQISVSDLCKFAQATVWAQGQLPRLSKGKEDPVGYSSTTEHRLGCIVTDVDGTGVVRVCLFDPATPLGKVRHTVNALIALSQDPGPE